MNYDKKFKIQNHHLKLNVLQENTDNFTKSGKQCANKMRKQISKKYIYIDK